MTLTVLLTARHYYPSPGAASNRLGALVTELRERGHEVVVITRALPGLPSKGTGVHGEVIHRVAGDTSTGVGVRRAADLLAFPVRAAILARRLRSGVDLVVCDPPPTVGLALLCSMGARRTVYYFADSWADLVSMGTSVLARLVRRPVRWVENCVLRRAGLVVTVTEGMHAGVRGISRRSLLVPNGVDGAVYTPEGGAWRPSGSSRPFLLYAGNFGEAHGASVFAKAAEILWRAGDESFDLVYMGYGSEAEEIERVASRWPDRLHLISPQDPQIAAAAFRSAVGGLVSVKDSPSLKSVVSVKALAALMCGCPVVYAGGGDFAGSVRAEHLGVVVERDPELLAAQLSGFVASAWDPSRRQDLADRVRARFDNRTGVGILVDALERSVAR